MKKLKSWLDTLVIRTKMIFNVLVHDNIILIRIDRLTVKEDVVDTSYVAHRSTKTSDYLEAVVLRHIADFLDKKTQSKSQV